MTVNTLQIVLVFVLVGGVLVAIVREWLAADIAVMAAAAILLVAGILGTDDVLGVFANSGPITVASMFVLSAALDRTGCVDAMGRVVLGLAGRFPALALPAMLVAAIALSAFINNTPVVVILAPVMVSLGRRLRQAPSRLLIPLSYAAILGGTCTLIGTSTNLLVDGVVRAHGLRPFGVFEITPLGVVLAVVGVAYIWLVGRWLLPDRETLAGLLADRPPRQFLAEVLVPHDSPVVGKTLAAAGLSVGAWGHAIDVIRGGTALGPQLGDVTLAAGDRLILQASAADVMGMRESGRISFVPEARLETIATENVAVVEGMVGPNSGFVGRRIADLNLRRRYGVYLIAVHRQNQNLLGGFDQVRLAFGDTVLLEGPPEGIKRLIDDQHLINLTEPTERPIRRDKAPIALAAVGFVVGLAALDVMPIAGLALVAAAAVAVTGCVRTDEIYEAIEWRVLMLIFGMLALSLAMEKTGALALVVGWVVDVGASLGPTAILALIYAVAVVLTEMVTNNAVALLMAPIAIGVAEHMGVDARPFLVAVMFAASASFATPIGYQTNTFVYGAGGYRFTDFLKIGVPLTLMNGILAIFVIPRLWAF